MKYYFTLILFVLSVNTSKSNAPQPGQRIWDIIADTQPKSLTAESKLCEISVDFSGIFTALDATLQQACTVHSELDIVESIAEGVELDFSGIFTSLDALNEKIATVQSKTNELDTSLFNIEGAFGIAIRNDDIGTTGFTITEPGTYFLAENINYAPSIANTAAITIDGDRIALNLNGRSIRQTNAIATTVGIHITGGKSNIQIKNGAVRNTTAQAILVSSGNTCIAISNLNTKLNENEAGIEFESGCSGLTLDFVSTVSSDNNGVLFDSCTDIHISNGLFVGNGIPAEGAGIRFLDSDRIQVTDCIFNDNTLIGVDYFSNSTSEQAEFRNCTLFNNGDVGFSFDNIQDVLITNCYVAGSTIAGARLIGCTRIKLIENYFDNNGSRNLWLNDGTNNCYIFGNCFMLASINLEEDATSGPNSILGNYALATAFANNYDISGSTTVVNDAEFEQPNGFSSSAPVSWRNINAQTT